MNPVKLKCHFSLPTSEGDANGTVNIKELQIVFILDFSNDNNKHNEITNTY